MNERSASISSAAADLTGATLLSVVLFGLFTRLAPTIHGWNGPPEIERYNTWLGLYLRQVDGVEVPAMLALTALFALAAWHAGLRRPAVLERPLVQFSVAALAAASLLRTSWDEFTVAPLDQLALELLAIALICGAWALVLRAGRRWLVVLAATLTLGSWWAFDVLSRKPAQTFDLGFFIAPALKLLQGERIGTFYMQYGLLQTRLVEAMLAGHLRLHQMEQLFALTIPLFLLGAALAARRLLRDRWVWLAFLVALVAVRDLGLSGGPTLFPQTVPLRLDLWLVVLLAALQWGVVSWQAALAAALVYTADNALGLLAFASYALSAAAAAWSRTRWTRDTLRQLAPVAGVLLAGAALQLAFTGSVTSQASQVYRSIHLGFLPIQRSSLFWPVAWIVLAAAWCVARLADRRQREAGLLLVALTVGQLVYFFGRSHDHNLLNLAGCWLLLAFLVLDAQLAQGQRLAWVRLAAGALALFLVVGLSGRAARRGERALDRIARGAWSEEHPLDLAVADCAGLHRALPAGARVFVWSLDEGYLNYRCGLPQQGFFAPFLASYDREETASYLGGLVRDGVLVVLPSQADVAMLAPAADAFSDTRFAQEQGVRFRLVPRGEQLRQLVLEPR